MVISPRTNLVASSLLKNISTDAANNGLTALAFVTSSTLIEMASIEPNTRKKTAPQLHETESLKRCQFLS
jgi:hypothetical protein